MRETVDEAIDFRAEMRRIATEHRTRADWWFTPWQPLGNLHADPGDWEMTSEWTGFDGLTSGYAMLDPTKVSLLCPVVDEDDSVDVFGVPAALVAALLRERGVVVEKTGFYSILMLFSIGVTRGKSATLLEELLAVKRLIDANAAVADALPTLFALNPSRYTGVGLGDLAEQMHRMLADADTGEMQEAISRHLPQTPMTPVDAFDALIRDRIDAVPVEELDGRVAAVLCVLYPPRHPGRRPGGTVHDRTARRC